MHVRKKIRFATCKTKVVGSSGNMELFAISRYTKESGENPKHNEKDILNKLLQKVATRKRKREEAASSLPEINKTGNREEQNSSSGENKFPTSPLNDDPIHVEATDVNIDDEGGFGVLGENVEFAKRQRVDVVLPSWLAHPTVISTKIAAEAETTVDAITVLIYLTPCIRQALKELNVTQLFPVQHAVIPWILNAHTKPTPFRPRDICVSAPTGSGKTLAFAIPVVQLLSQRVERRIRALVVVPVAELALQVYKVFKKLCEKTDLTVCLLSKQLAFPQEQEKLVECYKGKYYSKVDIIVTTPGRLVDHLHATKGFCLKTLKFLVIDEADRVMDAVFQNWLYHLDAHVRGTSDQLMSGRAAPLCYDELLATAEQQPHKLLFSATLSQDPEKLQNLRLFRPKLFTSVLDNLEELREKYFNSIQLIQQKENDGQIRGEFIGKYTTPAELTEKFCITESRLKPLTLYSLIKENSWQRFLCFANSAESAARLAFVLRIMCSTGNLVIQELSASIGAKERSTMLNKFAREKINGLICSDALARGIDVPDVDIVISYDPPRHIKTYIHRIGRTARAGRHGTAVTLLTQKELNVFNEILAGAGKVITEEMTVTSSTEEQNAKMYSNALLTLRGKIEEDKRATILQKERAKAQTNLHKDPSKMSIMEKLQVEADKKTLEEIREPKKSKILRRKNAIRQRKNEKRSQHKANAASKLK